VSGIVLAVVRWSDVAALLGKSPDMTHRFDIWSAVSTRITDQPVVGHGFVGWWPSWDPWFAIHSIDGVPMLEAHNVWLDLLMQTGIVGTVLFAIAIGYFLWRLWREFYASPRSVVTVLFVVLVALLIQSLTESRILIEWGLAVVVICALQATRIRTGLTSRR
jgi:O-antigen ligase